MMLELGRRRRVDGEGDDCRARRIAVEMAMFNYFAASALELFAEGAPQDSTVGRLAVARQQFAVSSGLAWSTLDSIREAARLETWTSPAPA